MSTTNHNFSTELSAQRKRVLEHLQRVGPDGMTTITAREELNVMMPAARIYELRWNYGYNIQLIWTKDTDAQGNEHSCARYVLLSGKWQADAA